MAHLLSPSGLAEAGSAPSPEYLPGLFLPILRWGSDKGQAGSSIDTAFLSLSLQVSLSPYTEIRFNVKPKPIVLKARCAKAQ